MSARECVLGFSSQRPSSAATCAAGRALGNVQAVPPDTAMCRLVSRAVTTQTVPKQSAGRLPRCRLRQQHSHGSQRSCKSFDSARGDTLARRTPGPRPGWGSSDRRPPPPHPHPAAYLTAVRTTGDTSCCSRNCWDGQDNASRPGCMSPGQHPTRCLLAGRQREPGSGSSKFLQAVLRWAAFGPAVPAVLSLRNNRDQVCHNNGLKFPNALYLLRVPALSSTAIAVARTKKISKASHLLQILASARAIDPVSRS